MPGRRARHGDRRRPGDAPGIDRGTDHGPLAAVEAHLDHGDAVRGLGFLDLVDRPGLHAAHVQEPVVGVLVVHGEEPVGRVAAPRGEREEVHAVVMHPRLRRLVLGAIARVALERWSRRDRVAPRVEHLGDVPGGHDQRIVRRHGTPVKPRRPPCASASRPPPDRSGASRPRTPVATPPARTCRRDSLASSISGNVGLDEGFEVDSSAPKGIAHSSCVTVIREVRRVHGGRGSLHVDDSSMTFRFGGGRLG